MDKLASLKTQVRQLEAELSERNSSLDSLAEETRQTEARVTELEQLNQALRAEKHASEEQLIELQSQVDTIKASLDMALRDRAAVTEKLASIQVTLPTLFFR